MWKQKSFPIALTIAGSDSGGGAGIQADLKTLAAHAVHGTTVITCVTAQNPKGVLALQAVKPEIVRHQLDAVFAELSPAAVKTGMLYSSAIIRVVAGFLRAGRRLPLVIDPVMISTSGARLLKPPAIALLKRELLPLAALVTPNLDEAQLLLGRRLTSIEHLRSAARELHETFGCAALVKGGHLRGRKAADIFYDGRTELLLTAPFIHGIGTHGTGCTYAAAITANLARGLALPVAVQRAKKHITQSIAHSVKARNHFVLNNFWR